MGEGCQARRTCGLPVHTTHGGQESKARSAGKTRPSGQSEMEMRGKAPLTQRSGLTLVSGFGHRGGEHALRELGSQVLPGGSWVTSEALSERELLPTIGSAHCTTLVAPVPGSIGRKRRMDSLGASSVSGTVLNTAQASFRRVGPVLRRPCAGLHALLSPS